MMTEKPEEKQPDTEKPKTTMMLTKVGKEGLTDEQIRKICRELGIACDLEEEVDDGSGR